MLGESGVSAGGMLCGCAIAAGSEWGGRGMSSIMSLTSGAGVTVNAAGDTIADEGMIDDGEGAM
jgi:hypothetical protein